MNETLLYCGTGQLFLPGCGGQGVSGWGGSRQDLCSTPPHTRSEEGESEGAVYAFVAQMAISGNPEWRKIFVDGDSIIWRGFSSEWANRETTFELLVITNAEDIR